MAQSAEAKQHAYKLNATAGIATQGGQKAEGRRQRAQKTRQDRPQHQDEGEGGQPAQHRLSAPAAGQVPR
ncbi:MAG: hypothetical protein P8X52_08450 [Limibacillus sp.]